MTILRTDRASIRIIASFFIFNLSHQSMDDILADMYRMARNMPGCVGFGVVIL